MWMSSFNINGHQWFFNTDGKMAWNLRLALFRCNQESKRKWKVHGSWAVSFFFSFFKKIHMQGDHIVYCSKWDTFQEWKEILWIISLRQKALASKARPMAPHLRGRARWAFISFFLFPYLPSLIKGGQVDRLVHFQASFWGKSEKHGSRNRITGAKE